MASLARDWREAGTGGDNMLCWGSGLGIRLCQGDLPPHPRPLSPVGGEGGKQLLCEALSRLGLGMGMGMG